ncbi:isopentenyl transferase family protein [Mesorhizobium sp. M0938]
MRESASGWRFQWHVRRLRLGNSDAFVERAKHRVTDMFVPRQGRPSSLQELVAHWNDDAVRPTLEYFDGYRCAIRFAREHSLTISEMPRLREELQQRWQEGDFSEWQLSGSLPNSLRCWDGSS